MLSGEQQKGLWVNLYYSRPPHCPLARKAWHELNMEPHCGWQKPSWWWPAFQGVLPLLGNFDPSSDIWLSFWLMPSGCVSLSKLLYLSESVNLSVKWESPLSQAVWKIKWDKEDCGRVTQCLYSCWLVTAVTVIAVLLSHHHYNIKLIPLGNS